LRNPGSPYDGTRHNIGGDIVASHVGGIGASFKRAPHGVRAEVAESNHGGARVVYALPTTFMNESGQSVAPLMRYYGVDLERLLVVHDDIDVPLARLKVQFGRGHGGNNGVRSTIGSLGTPDFWRLKVGVGRPPGRMDPADFVLKRFGSTEREDIEAAVYRATGVIERFIDDGGEDARQFAGELND
jgi:peptidyl-tRNA hydrolase, PTH1 family